MTKYAPKKVQTKLTKEENDRGLKLHLTLKKKKS